MRYLKQSTTVTVQVGPFLDDTDFKTAETALSPTIEISKAGAAYAARNSATAISHDADGWYRVELNTTDTNTVGPLMLKSTETGALHVWHEFSILPANAYDSLVAGTDLFDVSVTQWLGTAAATPTVAGVPEVDVTHWIGTAAATPTVAGVPEVDVTHFNGTAGIFSSGRPAVLGGYQGGMVWVDTVLGSAGTTSYVNGTVDKPVSSWANAQTIAAAVGLSAYHFGQNSLITLTGAVSDARFTSDASEGYWFSLVFDGNTLTGCDVQRAATDDILADSGTFRECWCFSGTHTLVNPSFRDCYFFGTHTLGMNVGGELVLNGSFGDAADLVTLDMVASGPNFTLTIVDWDGPVTISNIEAGDTVRLTVKDGSSVTLTGTGGTVTIGGFASVTDNRSGGTLTQTGNLTYTALKPTTAGRTLDVTATGAAGIDWANVENPTTVVGLSGTTVKTATDVETRLPAALVGGRIDANVGAISSDATAADNAEAFFDGTGYAGTGNTIPTVTTVTNQVTANVTALSGDSVAADNAEAFFDGTGYAGTGNVIPTVTTVTTVNGLAAGAITAAAVATGAIDADALAADAANEIADAYLDRASAVDGLTPRETMRLGLSSDTGKLSGAATTTVVIRDRADTKDRITATVDSDGNRTAVTVDAT